MVENSLEEMRDYELFSFVKLLPTQFFAVRVDGRAFHSEVKKMKMARPFDKKLRSAMNKAIRKLCMSLDHVLHTQKVMNVLFCLKILVCSIKDTKK